MLGRVALAIPALALSILAPGVSAGVFLQARADGELQQLTLEVVERTLLSELSTDTERLRGIESELRPVFETLPKNEHGALEPGAVRYALHRYFVQKHGWYVKGLEPAGQAWNASVPSSATKTRVPAYIQSLFEKRLHGEGMGLHDLAAFAATLLDFAHNDAVSDVMELYSAFRLSTTSPVRKEDVSRVIRGYLLQILDGNATIRSSHDLREVESHMIQDFPSWGEFKAWIEDVRQTTALGRSRRSLLSPELTLDNVVEEVLALSDRLGSFQDFECKSLKAALVEIEHKDTGRVLLSDFYREGLKGAYLFNEHVDFLRRLGALDESDPEHPSLFIANYLASQANCLAFSSFHSVCCMDECEGLMSHLEREIAAPSAPAARIAELVANLHSDTVDAPRNLSASLLSRLGEIAEHHDGLVPLHGRLFAQWMHHAYPLECSFPHAAGAITPLTANEWLDESGHEEVAAAEGERRRFVKASPPSLHAAGADSLPWMPTEELVVAPKRRPIARGAFTTRRVAAFAAVVALAVPIIRLAAKVALPGQAAWEKEKHLV